MKTRQSLARLQLSVAALTAAGSIHISAAQLTVSPNQVTNGYTGNIQITLSGVVPGSEVLLEKFVDFDQDGAVGAEEVLVESFRATDGQVTTVAGVRNRSVPGDDDLANDGTVHTSYAFALQSELNRAVGRYVYRATGAGLPAGGLLASFTVAQAAFASRVEGQIRQGSTGVPYAAAFLMKSGPPDYLAYADAQGHFEIRAPEGQYMLGAIAPLHLVNMGSWPLVNLTETNFTTVLITNLEPVQITVSGRIVGAGSGSGLSGFQIRTESEDGWTSLGATRADGTFTLACRTNQNHMVELSSQSAGQLGYLATDGHYFSTWITNALGVNVALDPVRCLIYGRLTNEMGQGLAGVGLELGSDDPESEVKTYTDSEGYYSAGVIPGQWEVQLDENLREVEFGVARHQASLELDQAVEVNLEARYFTTWFSGRVVDQDKQSLPQMSIGIYHPWLNGYLFTDTDADGRFRLGGYAGYNNLMGRDNTEENGYVKCHLTWANVEEGEEIRDVEYVLRKATRVLHGIVTDRQGNPVAGVTGLRARGNVGHLYHTSDDAISDAQGRFQLQLFDGIWQIWSDYPSELQARGFQQQATLFEVSATRTNATIVLPSSGEMVLYIPWMESGYAGRSFSKLFTVSGGAAPYTWALASGSAPLPDGLSTDALGLNAQQFDIHGTPASSGQFQIMVEVTDSQNHKATAACPFLIHPAEMVSPAGLQMMGGDSSVVPSLRVQGGPGASHVIESTADFQHWFPIRTATIPSASNSVIVPLEAGEGHRFYRARVSAY